VALAGDPGGHRQHRGGAGGSRRGRHPRAGRPGVRSRNLRGRLRQRGAGDPAGSRAQTLAAQGERRPVHDRHGRSGVPRAAGGQPAVRRRRSAALRPRRRLVRAVRRAVDDPAAPSARPDRAPADSYRHRGRVCAG
jgi:hypothetical protein